MMKRTIAERCINACMHEIPRRMLAFESVWRVLAVIRKEGRNNTLLLMILCFCFH